MKSIQTTSKPIDYELIAQELWKKFFREEISETRKIPAGFKNRSFYIKSKSDKEYVLKIYAQNFLTKPQIEERGKIVKQLENKNIPVLEMTEGLNGEFAQEITTDNQIFLGTLSKYIEVPFSETQVNLNITIVLADELRRLHKELSEIKHSDNFKKLDIITMLESFINTETLRKVQEYFEQKGPRSKRAKEFLNFYTEQGKGLLKYFKSRENLFKTGQLNHGDFNLGNFLVERGKIVKIFDFDELIIAPKTYEIALCIYYLDYPEEFYTDELLQIFIESYFKKDKINKEDVQDILAFMKYRAYYRLARYFTYYQFSDTPGGHFTRFRRHLEKFNEIDEDELYKILKS